jgi:hypothetical protein
VDPWAIQDTQDYPKGDPWFKGLYSFVFLKPLQAETLLIHQSTRVNPKENTAPRNLTQQCVGTPYKQRESRQYWANGIDERRNHDSKNHTRWYF